jgi:hypothetical protein
MTSSIYVPTVRYGKSNIYSLRRVLGDGPEQLKYQRSVNGALPYYYGADAPAMLAYSFSAIKRVVTPILDPGAEEGLKVWEARVGVEEASRIREESIQAGKMGHAMLAKSSEGKPLGAYPLSMEGYVTALRDNILPYLCPSSASVVTVDENDEMLALSEVFVVDFDQQFLGRLDLVAEIAAGPYEGRRVLLELKGSRKEKTLEHMRGNIVQAVSYMTTFNAIAQLCPDEIRPLDGVAMAYMYRSGNGEVIPFFGEELQEYIEEWQQWLACFHDVLDGRIAA